jgi:VanZ family protein
MIERLWRIAGWFGVVLTLALSLGPPAFDTGLHQGDKLTHLAGYAILMFWWAQLVTRQRWRLAGAVILFGVAVEFLQGFTPTREPDVLDALANSAGVLLGWLAARFLPNLPDRIAAQYFPIRT